LILVAGGTGSRMNHAVPKQFILINGKPIILHSLDAFFKFDSTLQCVVVMHHDWIKEFEKMIVNYSFKNQITIVKGGETRFQSAKNGLESIQNVEGIVGVHDAARPLVSQRTIQLAYQKAKESGNGVPAIGIQESLREVNGNASKAVNRDTLKSIQTPQCFNLASLKSVYSNAVFNPSFTDDATVFESAGHHIHLVEGNRENLKITNPEDVLIVETFLNNNSK
jgi:2-C-methyl-D-erythritol 4-phosphate cytidylyltransferase